MPLMMMVETASSPEDGTFHAGQIYNLPPAKAEEWTKKHVDLGTAVCRPATASEIEKHRRKQRIQPPEMDTEQKDENDEDTAPKRKPRVVKGE